LKAIVFDFVTILIEKRKENINSFLNSGDLDLFIFFLIYFNILLLFENISFRTT